MKDGSAAETETRVSSVDVTYTGHIRLAITSDYAYNMHSLYSPEGTSNQLLIQT